MIPKRAPTAAAKGVEQTKTYSEAERAESV